MFRPTAFSEAPSVESPLVRSRRGVTEIAATGASSAASASTAMVRAPPRCGRIDTGGADLIVTRTAFGSVPPLVKCRSPVMPVAHWPHSMVDSATPARLRAAFCVACVLALAQVSTPGDGISFCAPASAARSAVFWNSRFM